MFFRQRSTLFIYQGRTLLRAPVSVVHPNCVLVDNPSSTTESSSGGSSGRGGGGGGGGGNSSSTIMNASWNATDTTTDEELVSAIIATCNRKKPLNDAIISILSQTKAVLEVMVAIDSGDSCVQSIENIWGDKVRILKLDKCPCSTKCGKAGRARQYAMDHANPKATHFAFLDDDDVWLPHKMEVQLKAMKEDRVGIISSDALVAGASRCREGAYFPWDVSSAQASNFFQPMNLNYENIGKMLAEMFGGKIPTNITLAKLEIHNVFVTSSVVVSKEGLGQERFDTTVPNGQEDYGLWKRVLMHTSGTFIHDQLVIYDNQHGKEC